MDVLVREEGRSRLGSAPDRYGRVISAELTNPRGRGFFNRSGSTTGFPKLVEHEPALQRRARDAQRSDMREHEPSRTKCGDAQVSTR